MNNKGAQSGIVMLSMLFLGVGMFLAKGWLNDFQRFVKDKVGGDETPQQTGPKSGLQSGSSGDPAAGKSGGGGSW